MTYQFAECDRIGFGMASKSGAIEDIPSESGEKGACKELTARLQRAGLADDNALSVKTKGGEWYVLPYGNECSETFWLLLI